MPKRPNPLPTGAQLDELKQTATDNPDSARAQYRLGTAYLHRGMAHPAEEALRKALDLDPEHVGALVNLGGLKLLQWDFEACVEANARALEVAPGEVRAHYNKGIGHLYLGQAKEMVSCFERVLELDPDNAGGHYHMAVGLLAIGKPDEARAELDEAVRRGWKAEPAFIKAIEREDGGPMAIMEVGPSDDSASD